MAQEFPDDIGLTKSRRRALEAAARGEVTHDPHVFSFGFVNRASRSSQSVWWLWRAGLIEYGRKIDDHTVMMEPTAHGWAALGHTMCSPPRMLNDARHNEAHTRKRPSGDA
ncbi:hypothetical protein [Bradyrhizobium sp. McL0616]|uniref:hypothetical protein n=1 Tax=Bradyrhizobium sp. McL0616 TaxID=3415674 RepID=UPI003CE67EDE